MGAKNTYKPNTSRSRNGGKKKIRLSFNFLKDRRFHLSLGFILLGISVFLLTAFISFLFTGQADQSVVEAIHVSGIRDSGMESENWLGMVGAIVSHYFVFHWFGISAFFIPPFLFILGFKLVSRKEILPLYRSFKFIVFFIFWLCLLFGYTTLNVNNFTASDFLSGGLGYELAVLFHSLIGWGTYLFLILSFLIFIIYFFNITEIMGLGKKASTILPGKGVNPFDNGRDPAIHDNPEEALQEELELIDSLEKWKTRHGARDEDDIDERNDLDLTIEDQFDTDSKRSRSSEIEDELEFIVEDPGDRETAIDRLENYDPTLDLGTYKYPPLELLNEYDQRGGQVTKEELEQNKDKIIETLINFKIGISSIKATIGPTVTLYEIVPDAGIKISKIKNLEDDIALSLSALGIRIIAPIPGKGTIGIEVPNKNKTLVSIKSVLGTEKFQQTGYELPIVLGRTISNEVYLADLTKMPHLLIAGRQDRENRWGLM